MPADKIVLSITKCGIGDHFRKFCQMAHVHVIERTKIEIGYVVDTGKYIVILIWKQKHILLNRLEKHERLF